MLWEIIMINVTRLNGSMLVVNADIIQTIEETQIRLLPLRQVQST